MTDVPSKQRIGFTGLGHMGGPMHVNLVAAGHDVFGSYFPAEANETAREALPGPQR
jgi:3-hydroxyisobutyrate dehydrogenase-like beta-hydroxyacid dehydrogenase